MFSEEPFGGNPLPVILDAQDYTPDEMQRITRWMDLSETAFLLPPTDPSADYRVRIFTLDREMPFAGHPTLGSCHAWLSAGGNARDPANVVQECGIGLVSVRRADDRLAFAAPELIRSGPVEDNLLEQISTVLQIGTNEFLDAEWADNGPGWVVVLLESAKAVLAVEALRDFPSRVDIGIVGPHDRNSATQFEVRAFSTDHQGAIREDPVTGSLNASVAQWLLRTGRAKSPYVASQGTRLGRSGRIHINQEGSGPVWVGGNTTTLVQGNLSRSDLPRR